MKRAAPQIRVSISVCRPSYISRFRGPSLGIARATRWPTFVSIYHVCAGCDGEFGLLQDAAKRYVARVDEFQSFELGFVAYSVVFSVLMALTAFSFSELLNGEVLGGLRWNERAKNSN